MPIYLIYLHSHAARTNAYTLSGVYNTAEVQLGGSISIRNAFRYKINSVCYVYASRLTILITR